MNIKRDIQNNLFIIKCIYRSGKIVFGLSLFTILIDCVWTYVGTNLGLWVFDSIDKVSMGGLILFVVITLGLLVLIEAVMNWFHTLTIPIEKTKITEYMSNSLINKVFEIYQGDVENSNFFNIYSRAISEITTRPGEVLSICQNILSGLIQLVLLLVISTKLNWFFTIFFLTASIVSAVITGFINKQEYLHYEASTKSNRQLAYINRVIYQPEYGRLLRTNWGLRALLTNKNSEYSRDLRELIKKYGKKIAVLRITNTLLSFNCFEILPWLLAIYGLYNQNLSFGEVTVIMSITERMPSVFKSIFGSMATFHKESLYIENLKMVLEYKSLKKKKESREEKTYEILENAEHISFTYSANSDLAIKNVMLSIKKGELIAFVGPNGAGKTTLACLLAGLYMSSDGVISFQGQDINSISQERLTDKIIMIAQDSLLLSVSIVENILQRSPTCMEDYEIAEEALKKVGMYEKVKSLVKGIDTMVTKEFDSDGVVFSGGERQKIALARVYASDAELIILDEPTGALDAFSEKEIIDIMYHLAKNKTMIVISHRLSMVSCADRILFIDNGTITEQGTHEYLLQKKGRYYELFNTQADNYQLCSEIGD